METFIEYAPLVIVIIMFFLQYKLFVTPDQIAEVKSELIEYMAEHYLPERTYRDNHTSLENRMDSIDKNVNDVKTLLISSVQWHGSTNN